LNIPSFLVTFWQQQGIMLPYALKRELLAIARDSVAAAIVGKTSSNIVGPVPSSELLEPHGAFVTLRINSELRGCIGYMESSLPLAEVVAEVARKAALEDPRFDPLTLQELEQVTVEVSIISQPVRIHGKDEICIGKHGLILDLGYSKGVLLPQVATEYGWDAEQFLEGVCMKAGVQKLAWQNLDARISVFTAEVISEEDVTREHPA
jgi:AmmeMemoRadiSam system protein A